MTDDYKPITFSEATTLLEEQWIPYIGNKWFETKEIYAEHNINAAESKLNIRKALYEYTKKGRLEYDKNRARHRVVNRELDVLQWDTADPNDILDISWPYGIQDQTDFGFDDNLTLYPKSVVVIAGVSNMGKSTFMLNLTVMNMDNWNVRYMTNEMNAEEFADRMKPFEAFYDLTDDEGRPRFEAIERFEDYQDIILPDGLNIVDYLDPGENPYMVGQMIDSMRRRLNRGVVFIALQKKLTTVTMKDGTKKDIISDYGTGGQYSEHRARIVLHIERDHLYVKKAKKCRKWPLTGKRFQYQIIDGGSQFFGIHEMVKEDEEQNNPSY